MATRLSFATLLSSLLVVPACGDKIDQAKQALEVVKQVADKAGEAGKNAAAAAADENGENKPPETAEEAMAQMGAAVGALQDSGQLSGPVVNWRDLSPMLPDTLGSFSAKADVKGKTTTMGKIEVSEVNRPYEDGTRSLKVGIADTVFSPMMRTPFEMAAMISEDSSEGYKKGTKLAGYTALVEWKESSKRSHATVLVAGRFVVTATVNQATAHDEAQKIVESMALDKLAALAPAPEAE